MKTKTEPRTFDYTNRSWGHNVEITKVINEGDRHEVRGFLWGPTITEGDYLLLKNGAGSSRYRVTESQWMSNVDDMFKFTAIFAPREG